MLQSTRKNPRTTNDLPLFGRRMSIASRADHPVLRPGGHLASRMGISAISAGWRAFSRIEGVTQRHIVDWHHLEVNRAVGSFRTGLAARRGPMLGDMTIQR